MVKAGLTQEIVIAKIKTSICNFDTSPAALKELKATNIPDPVILTMVQARHAIPSQPPVDQILEKYIQARGGATIIQSRTSRVSKGSIELQNMGGPLVRGTIEFYAKAPNKRLSVIDLPGFGQVREGFDGTLGWEENPQTGILEKGAQNLSVAKRGAEFYEELRLRELYPKMAFKGVQRVGQSSAYLIDADPGDGSFRKMYFDTDTGLLVRNELEYDTPRGPVSLDWHFEDFRDVDGIKVPFTAHQSSLTGNAIYRLTEVRNDVPIDDAIFARPAQVAAIPTPLQPGKVGYADCGGSGKVSVFLPGGGNIGKNGTIVASLTCGEEVLVLREENGWKRIRTKDNVEGTVRDDYISTVKIPARVPSQSSQPRESARKVVQGIADAMMAYGWTASPHWRPGECQSRQNGGTTRTVCAPNDSNLDACIYDWETTNKFTCRTKDGMFAQY
jgi:hypothetical protein